MLFGTHNSREGGRTPWAAVRGHKGTDENSFMFTTKTTGLSPMFEEASSSQELLSTVVTTWQFGSADENNWKFMLTELSVRSRCIHKVGRAR
eukprot:7214952-Heterocapsa_arctica.AAC.1